MSVSRDVPGVADPATATVAVFTCQLVGTARWNAATDASSLWNGPTTRSWEESPTLLERQNPMKCVYKVTCRTAHDL